MTTTNVTSAYDCVLALLGDNGKDAGLISGEILRHCAEGKLTFPQAAELQAALVKREAAAAELAGIEKGKAAAGAGGAGKTVKEVVSTKPGWVTVRYTGRGFPTSGSVATWEALLAYLDKNGDKVRAIVQAVKEVGSDERAHKKLPCYSAAKESRD